jgi:NifU-like protein involved in Fe-S cluster formation
VNYSELTWQYFATAAGAGVLEGPGVFRGATGSRAQGTWVQFDVHVVSRVIRAARFLAFGCPHTIAVAAWVVEQATGHRVRTTLPESVAQLSERFAVPVEKRGRLLTIEDAWRCAVVACDEACGRPAPGA